jgi:MOSC domain-containing protein YiiM
MSTITGTVEAIFIVPSGGATMQSVDQVRALADCGLEGDRYCRRTGYWTGVDECQVTLIEGEGLDEIERTTGVRVSHGEHRRNIVTRGIRLSDLMGKQFQVGEAVFAYDRPRPPCRYIETLTQPGMTRALGRRGGICVTVVRGGLIRPGDAITLVPAP